MAYRFLLEVPRTMTDDANAAVSATGAAQVLVVRPSHGLGIDDEYDDLSIAAQNLGVIDDLYSWFRELQLGRPESRTSIALVLHDGRRISLHDSDSAQTIATIRRDQPWVERTIPKIGDHERERFATVPVPPKGVTAPSSSAVALTVATNEALGLTSPSSRIDSVEVPLTEGTIHEQGSSYSLVRVMDLAGPEHFYHDVLGLEMIGRIRTEKDGTPTYLSPEYDHFTAAQDNTEATFAFLTHGPLRIVLQRIGRAVVMDYGAIVNEFGLAVDPNLARQIKAQVLMRGYTLLGQDDDGFAFRDPYGVAWNIVPMPVATSVAPPLVTP